MNKIATLEELDTHWSIDDVDDALDAHTALKSAQQRAEANAAAEAA